MLAELGNVQEKSKGKRATTTTTTTSSNDAWDDEVQENNQQEGKVATEEVRPPPKAENVEEGFSVVHENELVDDWTLLDDSVLPSAKQGEKEKQTEEEEK